jgi:Rrf2 family protein
VKLSTKGRYGTRIMMDIALNEDKGPVLLREISKRQDISEKYLGNLIALLRNANLLKSKRGSKGGYNLAKPPKDIDLFEILSCLEGDMCIVDCVADPMECDRASECVSRQIWGSLSGGIRDMMRAVTLQSLADKQKSMIGGLDYSI